MAELSSELLRRRHLHMHIHVGRSTCALCRTQAAARARVRVHLIRTLTLTLALTLTLSLTLPLTSTLPLTRRMLGHLKLYLQHFNPANAPQVGVRDRVRVRVRVWEQVGVRDRVRVWAQQPNPIPRWWAPCSSLTLILILSPHLTLTLYPGGGRPAGRRLRAGARVRDAQQARRQGQDLTLTQRPTLTPTLTPALALALALTNLTP